MSIEELIKQYRYDINKIIKSYLDKYPNSKLEYDNLYQEATIKLWQLSLKHNLNSNFVLRCINNAIKDYIRYWNKDMASNADSYEELYK